MNDKVKAFINGDESREAIDAARDWLKAQFERWSEGGRKSKRKPILDTRKAAMNRERVARHRAKKLEGEK